MFSQNAFRQSGNPVILLQVRFLDGCCGEVFLRLWIDPRMGPSFAHALAFLQTCPDDSVARIDAINPRFVHTQATESAELRNHGKNSDTRETQATRTFRCRIGIVFLPCVGRDAIDNSRHDPSRQARFHHYREGALRWSRCARNGVARELRAHPRRRTRHWWRPCGLAPQLRRMNSMDRKCQFLSWTRIWFPREALPKIPDHQSPTEVTKSNSS